MVALRGELEERARDPDLLRAEQRVALMDAAAETLLERGVVEKDTPGFRREVLKAIDALLEQAKEDESYTVDVSDLRELREVVAGGVEVDRALSEVFSMTERAAKVALSARDTAAREENAFTAGQVSDIYRVLLLAAMAYIRDELLRGQADAEHLAIPHMHALDAAFRKSLGARVSLPTAGAA